MSKFLKNTSWLLINQVFQMILNFLVGIFTVRYLGPTNYGTITYVASYVALFSSFCTLGLDSVVINRLVHNENKDGEIITTAFVLRVFASLISMICLVFLVLVIDKGNTEIFWVTLIEGFQLVFASANTIAYWYQYKLESKKMAVAEMISFFLISAFKIVLLIYKQNVYWFASISTIQYLLILIFYLPMFKKDVRNRLFFSVDMAKELLRMCTPYLISAVLMSLYSQIDHIMIKQLMKSTEQVGYYSAATTICNLIAFVPSALILSSRPILMELRKRNDPNYVERLTQTLSIVIWISLLYSLFLTVFSKQIIGILYGNQYAPANIPLIILAWYTMFVNMTKIKDLWLISENLSRYVSIFSLIGVIANIVMNFFFIQIYGVAGAAFATLITQAMVSLILPAIFKETRPYALYSINGLIFKGTNFRELLKAVFKHK